MSCVKTTSAISKVARDPAPEHGIPKFVFCIVAALAAALLVLTGCGGGNGTNITSITISPTTTNVPINTQVDFTAVVNLANSTSTTTTTVTWEVNGTAGGSSTLGTIVSSAADSEVGVYTAPAVVPNTNNGEVSVTAVVICQSGVAGCQATTSSSSTTTTTTITSNTATATITAGLGLAISPTTATVPAGGTFQFSASLNGLTDSGASWSLSSTNGGTLGSIDVTGLYTAPLNPPPGSEVTVTATDPTSGDTATATATIVFSDRSLNGPYAFSYTGNDQSGFLAVGGSFVADGNGGISSGVEDINSFLNGVSAQVPISGGTYTVGSDGRGSAMVVTGRGTETWDFALANNQQGQLTRFDSNVAGGGTISQQNLNYINTISALTGPYVFRALGANVNFAPMGIAGAFSASGSGTIPNANAVLDVNNNGTVTTNDTSLQGTYSLDSTFSGTGRGILTLTSTTLGSLQYSFYIVDNTRLYLIETDAKDFLAGAIYSAPTGPTFSVASLSAANYTFTSGGNSGSGAYATGGVFASDGDGNVTGGVQDVNNAGTTQLATALGACPYTASSNVPRIDLKLFAGSGTCSGGSTVSEFATYLTAQGSAVLLEIDPAAVTAGTAYQQSSLAAFTGGGFALGLAGQGVFHNNPSAYQPDLSGQLLTTGASITSGNLDINNFNATFQSNPIATTGSSIGSPDSTHGRGTLVLQANNPTITLNLIYYMISTSTALVFDQDQARVAIGSLNRQF
jgi:hypothetical protein